MRYVASVGERRLPVSMMPLVQRIAPRAPLTQSWFPLQTPLVHADVPLRRHVPSSRAVVATSWRTAEEVLRVRGARDRAVYFLQGYETWSGPARRVDATWKAFDRMITSSRWLADLALERFRKWPEQVAISVSGVDLAMFRPGSAEVRSLPVIGFMYDDLPLKGAADILSAFEEVRSRREFRVRAFGLGTGPLPAWVEFSGPLSGEDLAGFYRSIDVFVAASHTEGGGPITVPEAMACGKAVISTDVGSVRTWSGDGVACRLLRPGDRAALARSVEELLDDPGERVRLGRAAVERIRLYTWGESARAFEQALVSFGLIRREGSLP